MRHKSIQSLKIGDCLIHRKTKIIARITAISKSVDGYDWYNFNSIEENKNNHFYFGAASYQDLIKIWKYCKKATILYGK